MRGRTPLWIGIGLVASGLVIIAVGAAVGASGPDGTRISNQFGPRPMMGGGPLGVMQSGPGSPGFVPGTASAPRVVQIIATPRLRFVPDIVTVKQGETIMFEVTTMGPTVHEFMVGPAADVAVDKPGTPEIADLGMMGTGTITYTFGDPGPYAYACHATGHFEAGMTGTIAIVP